jgi:hypothetical protein
MAGWLASCTLPPQMQADLQTAALLAPPGLLLLLLPLLPRHPACLPPRSPAPLLCRSPRCSCRTLASAAWS